MLRRLQSDHALILDHLETILESYGTRIVLSFLIVLSVLPESTLAILVPGLAGRSTSVFLSIFLPELMVRGAVYRRRRREGRATGFEPLLLLLDVLAVLSFLPMQHLVHDLAWLRLVRLTRMLLLLGYWGGMVRDLWTILSGRERRYQVLFVLFIGLLLAFGSAVVLQTLGASHDFNDDGEIGRSDRSFFAMAWWSFRQVQDPGNLVARPTHLLVVGVSLLLTFSGLLLFSFLVGIGTTAIEELMTRAREQPVGLRRHTVITGLGSHSRFLLQELADMYRKNLRPFQAAVLGPGDLPPDYFHDRRYRGMRYRKGEPDDPQDLSRLDLGHAKRLLILGPPGPDPDSRVVSAILASRRLAPEIDVYPCLEHEKSFPAARTAGGHRTHLVGSGTFLGYYLAQNVLYPGADRLYHQLLTSAGCEIYTYLWWPEERDRLLASNGREGTVSPRELARAACNDHQVTLIGFFLAPDSSTEVDTDDLEVLLDPAAAPDDHWAFTGGRLRWSALRGLVGISLRWEELRAFALELADARPPRTSPPRPEVEATVLPPLRPPARPPKRALVCGGSPRVPRLARMLVELYGPQEITVLVRSRRRVAPLARQIASSLVAAVSEENIAVEIDGGERTTARIRLTLGQGEVTVTVDETDWTDLWQLLHHPEVRLQDTDVVLFLPEPSDADEPDGLVALDCLRMAHLAASHEVAFQPGCRVVGFMDDPEKGDLLQRRLDEMADACDQLRFTIIAAERIRHWYVMQNVFVRGLNRVYLELLGPHGPHLARLLPDRTEGSFDAWSLGQTLLGRGSVLVGLEVGPEADVILDPAALAPGRRYDWSAVRALYLLTEREPGSAG